MKNENNNNFTVQDANMEPIISTESLAKKKSKGLDTRFYIHIHSKRNRQCDPDGVSAKAAIDGIVKAGILPDDSAKFVKKVSFTQEKCSSITEEETIITISNEE